MTENGVTTKSVVVIDLQGYSDKSRVLEQFFGPKVSLLFNEQIQQLVDEGLSGLKVERNNVVKLETGDGAILAFDEPDDAHRFSTAFHLACVRRNAGKTEPIAFCWFRIGVSTGKIASASKKGRFAGQAVADAKRLEAAGNIGEVLIDKTTFEGLSSKFQEKYETPVRTKGKREESFGAYRCAVVKDLSAKGSTSPVKSASKTATLESARQTLLEKLEKDCKVKIQTYAHSWTVNFETGVAGVEVHLKGISPFNGEPISRLNLFAHGTAFGLRRIFISHASQDFSAVLGFTPAEPGAPAHYHLQFVPGIRPGMSCDVSLVIEAHGTFFCNGEDQNRLLAVTKNLKGFDLIGSRILRERRIGQSVLRARFVGNRKSGPELRRVRIPKGIEIEVVDESGSFIKEEARSANICISHNLEHSLHREMSELIMTVSNPLPGHTYAAKWAIGGDARGGETGETYRIRNQLRNPAGQKKFEPIAEKIMRRIRELIVTLPPSFGDSQSCAIHLFVEDSANQMVCWTFDGGIAGPLGIENEKYHYGKGAPGLAFRTRIPIWSRRGGDGYSLLYHTDEFPDQLSAIVAVPVRLNNMPEDPICVVLLSSPKGVEFVTRLIEDQTSFESVVTQIASGTSEIITASIAS